MSVCSPCSIVLPVPYCTAEIQIGIGEANTDYVVQFLNTAMGRKEVELVTSDGDGVIVVEWLNRQEQATYEVSLWQNEPFTVDGITDEVTCISVRFDRLNDNYGPLLYTLTAA